MIKKTIIAAFCSVLTLSVFSQIVVDRNDMPNIGDSFRLSIGVMPPGLDYQATGANHVWDFQSMMPMIQVVDTFVAISTTPFIYQMVFNPTVASIAQPIPDFEPAPGFSATDIYFFFRETLTFFGQAGLALSFSEIPIPMKYDNPDILYRFPVAFPSTDSSESFYSLSMPGTGYYETHRNRVNHVDGWGTITTPYGTFQSIRIKSYLTTFDSIFVDSLQMGQALHRNITEYKWLGDNMGIPILIVSEEGGTVSTRYQDSVRTITGLHDIVSENEAIRCFPNPVEETLHVQFYHHGGGAVITLMDLTGRLIAVLHDTKLAPGTHQFGFSIREKISHPGMYIIRLFNGRQWVHSKIMIR